MLEMKASRVSRMKVTRTPGRRFYCMSSWKIRIEKSRKLMWHVKWDAHIKEEARKMPCEKQICPQSATKPGRQEIPTFYSVAAVLPL